MKINELDFEELKGNKKNIYTHLWNKSDLDFEVQRIGKSDFSYQFEINNDIINQIGSGMANVFALNERELFLEKFRQACSGNGNEISKITTLHSSSLCSLLFFYNVTEKHPLKIGDYTFTKTVFEFKNKVIKRPSNIDVVLLGKDSKGKNVVLFLESKFSEYIIGITKANSEYKLGKSYLDNKFSKPIYIDKSILKNMKLELKENDKSDLALFSSTDKYIEGLKQMVSHYVGIRNFLNGDFYENENLSLPKGYSENSKILLGEILFDNFGRIFTEQLNSYKADYEILAKKLNEELKNVPNCKVLGTSLLYSSLKNFPTDEKVRKFYGFN